MYRVIAVTNRKLCRRPFLEQIESVAGRKPQAIILREKDLAEEEYQELAEKVLAICRNYQVELIIHNYPAVAKNLGVGAIHLSLPCFKEYFKTSVRGGEYKSFSTADFTKIGCSVHSLEEAREAEALGAAYLTAGHIYATDCKRGLPPRGLAFLEEICRNVTVPVYAIGGIGLTDGRIEEVLMHGAKGACIMSEMMKK